MEQQQLFAFPHKETSTAYIIDKTQLKYKHNLLNLRSKLSVVDYMTRLEIPTAYFEDDNYVMIPKIKKEVLEGIMGQNMNFDNMRLGIKKKNIGGFNKITLKPLKHQVGIINDAVKHYRTQEDKRICVCARPGFGKTYMAAKIVSDLNCKFIFLVYSGKLVDQTYKAFAKYMGKDGLYILKSSGDFLDIDWKQVKGLFLTHSMIQVLIKNYGEAKVSNIFHNKMGACMKILDEFDRHVKNMYYLECWTNFYYSLYLTGTKFKNIKPDDKIFQMIYKNVKTLGADVVLENDRHALLVNYKFSPASIEYFKLMWDDGSMFKIRYNDLIARKDVLLDYIMKTFYKPEDSIIKSVIKQGDSVAIYAGRIENCEIVKDKLISHFGIDEKDIGIYNSSISKSDKEKAETKTWIITTTESIGRGYDNSSLRVLIFLEFNFGMSTYIQNVSRVARVGGKRGWVIEGIDHSFSQTMGNFEWKKRSGTYKDLFKTVTVYNVPENAYPHYYYGYRPNEKFAIELKEKMYKKNKNKNLSRML